MLSTVAIIFDVFITFKVASLYLDSFNSILSFAFLVYEASHREITTAMDVAIPETHVPIMDQNEISSGDILSPFYIFVDCMIHQALVV